jgi:phospholipid/cholesterol/gamma-HCH transport system ATP-binding protein
VIREQVARFLDLVDMSDAADKYPSALSGGMRKRAALARAMVAGPKVLLCDEPTSGLDPVRSRDISELIRTLSRSLGCTTVITTHDVPNALRCADRGLVLNNGRIVVEGVEAQLRACPDPFVKKFLQ